MLLLLEYDFHLLKKNNIPLSFFTYTLSFLGQRRIGCFFCSWGAVTKFEVRLNMFFSLYHRDHFCNSLNYLSTIKRPRLVTFKPKLNFIANYIITDFSHWYQIGFYYNCGLYLRFLVSFLSERTIFGTKIAKISCTHGPKIVVWLATRTLSGTKITMINFFEPKLQ